MDGVKVIQFILIFVLLGVIFYLLRLYHTLKLEKRLAPFAITSVIDEEVSFFDKVFSIFNKIVKKLSHYLKKSQVLSQYGETYNKYISYEMRNKKEGIDTVSVKFLLGFLVVILGIASQAFHNIHLSFMIYLIVFMIVFFIPDIVLHILFQQKRKRIEDDLLKAIIIMNNAFSSGKNIIQATQIVQTDLDGPIQDEFKKIYLDITYGLSLEVVFNRFYERVRLEDARYIASSLTLLNKTGGDIVRVFSGLEKSIFDRKNLKNELHSLTASSRFLFKFLVGLPFVFVFLIFILNPTYFKPFFDSIFGGMILLAIVSLYILYIIIVRKVLRVDI